MNLKIFKVKQNTIFCREWLGPDLVIVVLTMSSADRRKRILARHSDDVNTADMMDVSNF